MAGHVPAGPGAGEGDGRVRDGHGLSLPGGGWLVPWVRMPTPSSRRVTASVRVRGVLVRLMCRSSSWMATSTRTSRVRTPSPVSVAMATITTAAAMTSPLPRVARGGAAGPGDGRDAAGGPGGGWCRPDVRVCDAGGVGQRASLPSAGGTARTITHSFARKALCARVCITETESANLYAHNFARGVFALVRDAGPDDADLGCQDPARAVGIRGAEERRVRGRWSA